MGAFGGPDIVTNGLVFLVDAGSTRSYSGSGTTAYDLVTGETATLTNGVGFNSANGGFWEFDGTDDYISLPSSLATALNGGTQASVFIWIRLNNQNNTVGDTGIIQLSNFDNSNGNLYFYNNGYTYLDIFRTDRVSQVFPNNTIDATSWQLLTITTLPGASNWRAYLNGVLVKQATGQNTVSVNSSIQGGLTLGRNNTSRFTYGDIAACQIYNTALTDVEVLQNYNAQKNRFI